MEKTNQPLYQQLMEDVRSQIENSLLLPGDKLPTEREFMQKYNVSRITVSKALNELKAEGLITRFPNKGSFVARSASPLAAAAQVPLEAPSVLLPASASAQLPAVPEGSTSDTSFTEIACILPSFSDQFSLSMVNGILSAFPIDSYICHLFQSFNPSLEKPVAAKCIDTGISGIVLFPQDQPYFSEQLLYLLLQKYPLVLIDRNLPRLDTSYVIGDNKTRRCTLSASSPRPRTSALLLRLFCPAGYLHGSLPYRRHFARSGGTQYSGILHYDLGFLQQASALRSLSEANDEADPGGAHHCLYCSRIHYLRLSLQPVCHNEPPGS